MKFTSAPWSVYRLADDVATYGSNAGKCIVTAESGDYEVCGVIEKEEDACLIAAAPQLLQACEDALLYLQTARGWLGSTPMMGRMEDAIQKAWCRNVGGTKPENVTTLSHDLLKALKSVLDSLGALTNPSELHGWMSDDEQKKVWAAIVRAERRGSL